MQPRALVTGASSGIGLAIARRLAADGYDLVLSARRAEVITALAQELRNQFGIDARPLPADLSQPGAARAFVQTLEGEKLPITVLVNSAGTGEVGELSGADPGQIEKAIMVNVLALTNLTRLLLPSMLSARRGHILNVASLVAYQPGGPGMAVYYATKSYVLSFSRALRQELRHTGVGVTVLSPGPTRSEFGAQTGLADRRLFRWARPMDPATVADAAVRAIALNRMEVVPGLLNKVLAVAGELPPRRIALALNRFLLSRA